MKRFASSKVHFIKDLVSGVVLVSPPAGIFRLEYRCIVQMHRCSQPVVQYYGPQERHNTPRRNRQRNAEDKDYHLHKYCNQISQERRHVPSRGATARWQVSLGCHLLGEGEEVTRRSVVCYEDRQPGDTSTRTRNQQMILCK